MSFNWDDVRTALIEAEGDIHAAAAEILASAAKTAALPKIPENDINTQILFYIVVKYLIGEGSKRKETAKTLKPEFESIFVPDTYTGEKPYGTGDALFNRLGNLASRFSSLRGKPADEINAFLKDLKRVPEDSKLKIDNLMKNVPKTAILAPAKTAISAPISKKNKSKDKRAKKEKKIRKSKSKSKKQTTIPRFNPEASRSGKTPQVSEDEGEVDMEPISGLDVDVKADIEHEVTMHLRRYGPNPGRMQILASKIKDDYKNYKPDEIQAYIDKVNAGQSENAIEAVADILKSVDQRLEKKSKTTQMEDIDSISKKYPQFPRESIESYYNYILKADSKELTEQELLSDDDEESIDFIDQGDDVPSDIDVTGNLQDLPPDPLQFGIGTYAQYFTTNFGKRIRIISDTASGDIISMTIIQEQPIESDEGELQTGFTVRSRR